jgi:hypothetical protein
VHTTSVRRLPVSNKKLGQRRPSVIDVKDLPSSRVKRVPQNLTRAPTSQTQRVSMVSMQQLLGSEPRVVIDLKQRSRSEIGAKFRSRCTSKVEGKEWLQREGEPQVHRGRAAVPAAERFAVSSIPKKGARDTTSLRVRERRPGSTTGNQSVHPRRGQSTLAMRQAFNAAKANNNSKVVMMWNPQEHANKSIVLLPTLKGRGSRSGNPSGRAHCTSNAASDWHAVKLQVVCYWGGLTRLMILSPCA